MTMTADRAVEACLGARAGQLLVGLVEWVRDPFGGRGAA